MSYLPYEGDPSDAHGRALLAAWSRLTALIPVEHLEEFGRLFETITALEAAREVDAFVRGTQRGIEAVQNADLRALDDRLDGRTIAPSVQ